MPAFAKKGLGTFRKSCAKKVTQVVGRNMLEASGGGLIAESVDSTCVIDAGGEKICL